jgi:hypothetical protein
MTQHKWKQWNTDYRDCGYQIKSMEECENCGVSRESSHPKRGKWVMGAYVVWAGEETCDEVFEKNAKNTAHEQFIVDVAIKEREDFVSKYNLLDGEYYWVKAKTANEPTIAQCSYKKGYYGCPGWIVIGQCYEYEVTDILAYEPLQHITKANV